MPKSNLKALLLNLLARRLRRWADSLAELEDDRAESVSSRSTERGASAPSAHEPASESHAEGRISSASQKAELDQADQSFPDRPAGPPEDWLRRMSAGPPAHWVERVRQAAPDLLRQEGEGESVMTARVIEPSETRPKPPPPPLRLERPMTTPPRQAQSVGSDEPPSFTARILGESHSESAGRILSSDKRREPLAERRPQVDRHRPQAERRRPSLTSSPDVRESPAGEETVQAERRDVGPAPQPEGFATSGREGAGGGGRGGVGAQADQSGEEMYTVVGEPIRFRSDWIGGQSPPRQRPRIETPKPPPKTAEGRESRRHAEPASYSGSLTTSPVATLRHEVIYQEIAQTGARDFQTRVAPDSDSGDDRRSRARPRATRSSTMPFEPAKAAESRFASDAVSLDRWPELPEPPDFTDEIASAWLELSRRRRLAHEQIGSVWSE